MSIHRTTHRTTLAAALAVATSPVALAATSLPVGAADPLTCGAVVTTDVRLTS